MKYEIHDLNNGFVKVLKDQYLDRANKKDSPDV